jgi:hypothetical protein
MYAIPPTRKSIAIEAKSAPSDYLAFSADALDVVSYATDGLEYIKAYLSEVQKYANAIADATTQDEMSEAYTNLTVVAGQAAVSAKEIASELGALTGNG